MNGRFVEEKQIHPDEHVLTCGSDRLCTSGNLSSIENLRSPIRFARAQAKEIPLKLF